MIFGVTATDFVLRSLVFGTCAGYLVAGAMLAIVMFLWRGGFDPYERDRHANRDFALLTWLVRGALVGTMCLLALLFSLFLRWIGG